MPFLFPFLLFFLFVKSNRIYYLGAWGNLPSFLAEPNQYFPSCMVGALVKLEHAVFSDLDWLTAHFLPLLF